MHIGAEAEVVKDELRCKRSDGKGWRCRAPAMSGHTLCENHFKRTQLRCQRKKNGEQPTKKMKSIQALSGFAQGKWDFKDGNVGFRNEQEAWGTDINEDVEAKPGDVDVVSRMKSLTRMTLALLLQNLTRIDFIQDIVTLKMQRCKEDPGATWKVFECKPYIMGEPENPDMYFLFLDYLCKLAEEDHTVVGDIFGVAEKGSTGEGDRIEYLFRSSPSNEVGSRAVFEPVEGIYVMGYSRKLPSPKQWGGGMRVCVHLTLSQFVKGKDHQHLSALEGAALPIAQLLPTYQSTATT